VREDYSADGDAWRYLPHDHARSRAYRWGEDGLLGWTDRQCRLCFAVALWNRRDPILKERLFDLSGPEGNHGEDVKECYYYLDATPTHSYAKGLYKYPQPEFPYLELVRENARRTRADAEFELIDTGIFDASRYFDVFVEYAKAGSDDAYIRSKPLPTGGHLQQADGTAWMGFYCLTMLAMAVELAQENPAYQDMASKFFEHFTAIADAINHFDGAGLWDETDGFYYDHLRVNGSRQVLRSRSMVGLIPLLAVEILDDRKLEKLGGFRRRMNWFLKYRPDLARLIAWCEHADDRPTTLLALPTRDRLERILRRVLDESEFLSPFGIRSLSAVHRDRPFQFALNGETHSIAYAPGESPSWMFGGNSNWRGPIWFPINYLLIEALERYHHFYGGHLTVECPAGSGIRLPLDEVARHLARRLASLFIPGSDNSRPCLGPYERFASDPHWRNLVLFHEYFHGDTGRGLGAAHQTGWTALVTRFIEDTAVGGSTSRGEKSTDHASPAFVPAGSQ
jgi:hypothetical protein